MATCLCANDLNRLVTVKTLKSTAVVDSSGHVDKTDTTNWEVIGKEWVQFITQGSREFRVGDQVTQQLTHQITMRWSVKAAAQYTTECKLEYGTRTFNIAGPPQNIDEKNQWLRFGAIELAGA